MDAAMAHITPADGKMLLGDRDHLIPPETRSEDMFAADAFSPDPVLVVVPEVPDGPVVRLPAPLACSPVVGDPDQPSERQDSARSSMSMVPSSSRMSITRS